LVNEAATAITTEDEIPLEGLEDIRSLLFKSKIENAILNPIDILHIHDTIRVFRLIKSFFRIRFETFPLLSEEVSNLFDNKFLEKHITDAIDDGGLVKDTASPELSRIRKQITEKSINLRNRLKKILKRVAEEEIITEDFFTIREGRFVLPIKSSYKRQVNGIIHGISQTGQTVFMEPGEIIEMNNDLSLLQSEEQREVYKILSHLTSEIGREADLILYSIHKMAHIDAVIAKARYALEYGGVKPQIEEENYIELRNIRHPLLVHQKGIKNVIPLKIDFDGKTLGHLISGPNAGGKTVALKSIGLNILMALSGIFPLGVCRTNFRTVYSSIGDRQSIENDLSTFSSQILQLKQILDECTDNSLVLVDEIGSGTDPQEGAALACGILDSFINIKLFFVATTHQSSLKTYALTKEEIANASLEFDEIKLAPTYNFLNGIPGNSYAFFLAKNVGLANHILERSKKYLGERHEELEESITMLSKYRKDAQEIRNSLAAAKLEAEKQKEKYEEKLLKIAETKKEILAKAKLHASEIVSGANALIENTIKDIREEKKKVGDIKKEYTEKKELIIKEIEKSEKNKQPNSDDIELETGDAVRLDDGTSIGQIYVIDDERKSALVEFGGLKFNVSLSKLSKVKKSELKNELKKSSVDIRFDAETKLDLRGERAEQALRMLDNFISDAILSNLTQISIVHGKGTGALRVAVHESLRHHPSIKNFRTGTLMEGGDGITIAEL